MECKKEEDMASSQVINTKKKTPRTYHIESCNLANISSRVTTKIPLKRP